jgi:DNA-binding NtrC family response regulator
MCDSLDEVGQFLPSDQTAVLVSPSAVVPESNAADASPQPGAKPAVDQLVERILEQNNGHSRTLAARVDLLEQKIIEYSLHRNRQHRKETAAELGISRVTLYNKMKKFGLLD